MTSQTSFGFPSAMSSGKRRKPPVKKKAPVAAAAVPAAAAPVGVHPDAATAKDMATKFEKTLEEVSEELQSESAWTLNYLILPVLTATSTTARNRLPASPLDAPRLHISLTDAKQFVHAPNDAGMPYASKKEMARVGKLKLWREYLGERISPEYAPKTNDTRNFFLVHLNHWESSSKRAGKAQTANSKELAGTYKELIASAEGEGFELTAKSVVWSTLFTQKLETACCHGYENLQRLKHILLISNMPIALDKKTPLFKGPDPSDDRLKQRRQLSSSSGAQNGTDKGQARKAGSGPPAGGVGAAGSVQRFKIAHLPDPDGQLQSAFTQQMDQTHPLLRILGGAERLKSDPDNLLERDKFFDRDPGVLQQHIQPDVENMLTLYNKSRAVCRLMHLQVPDNLKPIANDVPDSSSQQASATTPSANAAPSPSSSAPSTTAAAAAVDTAALAASAASAESSSTLEAMCALMLAVIDSDLDGEVRQCSVSRRSQFFKRLADGYKNGTDVTAPGAHALWEAVCQEDELAMDTLVLDDGRIMPPAPESPSIPAGAKPSSNSASPMRDARFTIDSAALWKEVAGWPLKPNAHGSAFFVSPKHVVTCFHCLASAQLEKWGSEDRLSWRPFSPVDPNFTADSLDGQQAFFRLVLADGQCLDVAYSQLAYSPLQPSLLASNPRRNIRYDVAIFELTQLQQQKVEKCVQPYQYIRLSRFPADQDIMLMRPWDEHVANQQAVFVVGFPGSTLPDFAESCPVASEPPSGSKLDPVAPADTSSDWKLSALQQKWHAQIKSDVPSNSALQLPHTVEMLLSHSAAATGPAAAAPKVAKAKAAKAPQIRQWVKLRMPTDNVCFFHCIATALSTTVADVKEKIVKHCSDLCTKSEAGTALTDKEERIFTELLEQHRLAKSVMTAAVSSIGNQAASAVAPAAPSSAELINNYVLRLTEQDWWGGSFEMEVLCLTDSSLRFVFVDVKHQTSVLPNDLEAVRAVATDLRWSASVQQLPMEDFGLPAAEGTTLKFVYLHHCSASLHPHAKTHWDLFAFHSPGNPGQLSLIAEEHTVDDASSLQHFAFDIWRYETVEWKLAQNPSASNPVAQPSSAPSVARLLTPRIAVSSVQHATRPCITARDNTIIGFWQWEMLYSSQTFAGMSGGPVLLANGELVAIHRREGPLIADVQSRLGKSTSRSKKHDMSRYGLSTIRQSAFNAGVRADLMLADEFGFVRADDLQAQVDAAAGIDSSSLSGMKLKPRVASAMRHPQAVLKDIHKFYTDWDSASSSAGSGPAAHAAGASPVSEHCELEHDSRHALVSSSFSSLLSFSSLQAAPPGPASSPTSRFGRPPEDTLYGVAELLLKNNTLRAWIAKQLE